jgi:hypothetical protein
MRHHQFDRITYPSKLTQSFCSVCDRMVGVAAATSKLELAERAHVCRGPLSSTDQSAA